MNMKYRKILAVTTAMMIMLSGCGAAHAAAGSSDAGAQTTSVTYDAASKSEMFTERDLSGEYDEAAALKISLNGSSAEVTEEGTETKASAVSIDGSTITITAEGTYIFSGTLDDGMIVVDGCECAAVCEGVVCALSCSHEYLVS